MTKKLKKLPKNHILVNVIFNRRTRQIFDMYGTHLGTGKEIHTNKGVMIKAQTVDQVLNKKLSN